MPVNPKRIIISRTDHIGDVILTLAYPALLKQHYPDSQIIFLAHEYLKDLVESCPHVDEFVSWDELSKLPESEAVEKVKLLQADWIIHVYPREKISRLAWKAGIKHRVGRTFTSKHWHNLRFCNHRLRYRGSNTTKHHAQLHLQLLSPLNIATNKSLSELTDLISLSRPETCNDKVNSFIDPNRFNLVIHPLSNGSAREWPLDCFQDLIQHLSADQFNIIITGTEKESHILRSNLIAKVPHVTDTTGKLTLSELMCLIAASDGLVANSTGPLHLGAALGIKTLGLFPPIPTKDANRWQPLGKQAEYLQHSTVCPREAHKLCRHGDCACMRKITVEQVKQKVLNWQQQ